MSKPAACAAIEADLHKLEKLIYDIETQHLSTTGSNIATGWASFQRCARRAHPASPPAPRAPPLARLRCYPPAHTRLPLSPRRTLFTPPADGAVEHADRVFSLSSLSSPLGAAPWPDALVPSADAPRVIIVINKSHKKASR